MKKPIISVGRVNWNIACNGNNMHLEFPQLLGTVFGRLQMVYQVLGTDSEVLEEGKYVSLEDRNLGKI